MKIDELIKASDKDNMLGLLQNFEASYADAESLTQKFAMPKLHKPDSIAFVGMGGSALGAELALALLGQIRVPVAISRDYDAPTWVNEKTLVFAFSYSGNTEETLAATEDARLKGATLIGASAGGKLQEYSKKHGFAHLGLPPGMPPRLSFHYFLLFVVRIFDELGLGKADLSHIQTALARSVKEFDPKTGGGDVLDLAERVQGRTLLLYASSHLSAVSRVWKAQFNENAKTFLHVGEMSEVNHNEIEAWKNLAADTKDPAVLLLQSSRDTGQMAKRFEFTAKALEEAGTMVIRLHTEGEDWAAEVFSGVLFGLWSSFYLAALKGENPTDIAAIIGLKEYLA